MNQYKKCAREGCMNERIEINGVYSASYCSKQCELQDANKGALAKNQDAVYRQAAAQRSKSPIQQARMKPGNFASLDGQ